MDIFFDLFRTNLQPYYTEGHMLYRGKDLCDTLEDVVRDTNADGDLQDKGESKIYGKTAIPYTPKESKGYPLRVTWSPTFKKDMVLIENVPEFEGVRLHWGATARNTEGCPLVGKKSTPGVLANSGMTDKLVSLVKLHEERGDKCYLRIR